MSSYNAFQNAQFLPSFNAGPTGLPAPSVPYTPGAPPFSMNMFPQITNPTFANAGSTGLNAATSRAAQSSLSNLPSFAGRAAQVGTGNIPSALGQMPVGTPAARPFFGPGLPGAVAPEAASVGRLAALRSLPSTLNAANGGIGLGFRGANGAMMGAAGRVGLGATIGSLGSWAIDKTNIGGQNSNLEQGLQGAALGAGIGGSVGSIIPGVGTAIGAGVGGVVGGAAGVISNTLFGGGDKPSVQETLNKQLGEVPISGPARDRIRQQFEFDMMFAENAEDKDAAEAAALQNAQMAMQQAWSDEQTANDQAQRALAFQMSAQNFMRPQLANMMQEQDAYSSYIESIADTLPVEYQQIARMTAGRGRSATARTAAAYAQQVATLGPATAVQDYYGDVQNAAAQQVSAQIAQGVNGGGGSGNITDLLTSQMLAGQ